MDCGLCTERGQWTKRVRFGQQGQAMLELAIFGALTIGALGFLIRIGMKMNYDQEIRMAAFRRALAAASADNQTDMDAMGTAFHYVADRQMPSPNDGFMSLLRERTEASAFVEWGDRLSFAFAIDKNEDGFTDDGFKDLGYKTQPLIVVRSNNAPEKTLRNDDIPKPMSLPGGGGTLLPSEGIVKGATTANVTSGRITQSTGRSSVSSTTTTSSKTQVNTRFGNQDLDPSIISTSQTVNW